MPILARDGGPESVAVCCVDGVQTCEVNVVGVVRRRRDRREGSVELQRVTLVVGVMVEVRKHPLSLRVAARSLVWR